MGSFGDVHLNTVRRHLRSIGQVAYRPVKSPYLSAKQMKTRLQWCLRYQGWTVEDWKKVRDLEDFLIKKI